LAPAGGGSSADVIAAADNSLTARIDGVRQFIDAMQPI
jgi:hypothetical protein